MYVGGGLLHNLFSRNTQLGLNAKSCCSPGPTLLGCNKEAQQKELDALPDPDSLDRHREEDQVDLDVNRSFVYYPAGMPASHIIN